MKTIGNVDIATGYADEIETDLENSNSRSLKVSLNHKDIQCNNNHNFNNNGEKKNLLTTVKQKKMKNLDTEINEKAKEFSTPNDGEMTETAVSERKENFFSEHQEDEWWKNLRITITSPYHNQPLNFKAHHPYWMDTPVSSIDEDDDETFTSFDTSEFAYRNRNHYFGAVKPFDIEKNKQAKKQELYYKYFQNDEFQSDLAKQSNTESVVRDIQDHNMTEECMIQTGSSNLSKMESMKTRHNLSSFSYEDKYTSNFFHQREPVNRQNQEVYAPGNYDGDKDKDYNDQDDGKFDEDEIMEELYFHHKYSPSYRFFSFLLTLALSIIGLSQAFIEGFVFLILNGSRGSWWCGLYVGIIGILGCRYPRWRLRGSFKGFVFIGILLSALATIFIEGLHKVIGHHPYCALSNTPLPLLVTQISTSGSAFILSSHDSPSTISDKNLRQTSDDAPSSLNPFVIRQSTIELQQNTENPTLAEWCSNDSPSLATEKNLAVSSSARTINSSSKTAMTTTSNSLASSQMALNKGHFSLKETLKYIARSSTSLFPLCNGVISNIRNYALYGKYLSKEESLMSIFKENSLHGRKNSTSSEGNISTTVPSFSRTSTHSLLSSESTPSSQSVYKGHCMCVAKQNQRYTQDCLSFHPLGNILNDETICNQINHSSNFGGLHAILELGYWLSLIATLLCMIIILLSLFIPATCAVFDNSNLVQYFFPTVPQIAEKIKSQNYQSMNLKRRNTKEKTASIEMEYLDI